MNFSVITVVFNDAKQILFTMDSVLNQTFKEIEYILIDGGSTDGTKEIIYQTILSICDITHHFQDSHQLYLEATHKIHSHFKFKFLSQKDNGIFDAMNRGVKLATYDFINFVNCGDKIFSHEVLTQISQLSLQNFDVIYGDMQVCHNHESYIKKTSHNLEDLFSLFYNFGHSNCFIRTTLHQKNLYNLNYKLACDYDLIYKLYRNGFSFAFCNLTISSFYSGGASDKNGFSSLKEAFIIANHYNQNISVRCKILFYYLFALTKKSIKIYTPAFIGNFLLKIFKKTKKLI